MISYGPDVTWKVVLNEKRMKCMLQIKGPTLDIAVVCLAVADEAVSKSDQDSRLTHNTSDADDMPFESIPDLGSRFEHSTTVTSTFM